MLALTLAWENMMHDLFCGLIVSEIAICFIFIGGRLIYMAMAWGHAMYRYKKRIITQAKSPGPCISRPGADEYVSIERGDQCIVWHMLDDEDFIISKIDIGPTFCLLYGAVSEIWAIMVSYSSSLKMAKYARADFTMSTSWRLLEITTAMTESKLI